MDQKKKKDVDMVVVAAAVEVEVGSHSLGTSTGGEDPQSGR